jgi:competence protein ComEC
VRVDPLLLVATSLLAGSLASTSPGPTCAAAALIAVLAAGHTSRRVVLLAALAFGVGAARGALALRVFEAERLSARDALAEPRRCSIFGEVAKSPLWIGGQASYEIELVRSDCDGTPLPALARVRLYGGPADLRRGDELAVTANLGALQLFRNLGVADPTPRAARAGVVLSGGAEAVEVVRRGRGLGSVIDRARAHARERILATFAPAAAPMARALVLGENDLDPEDGEAFRLSGLSHILAVSGTHLVFAVVGVVRALTFFLVRIEAFAATVNVARLAAVFGAALALLYADFAGGSGSAWRAAFMLAAAFSTRALGRRPSACRTFAASMLIGAMLDPLAAFDVSFLLSLAATGGLIAIGQPLARRCEGVRSAALRVPLESVIATVSAMLPCAPLLAALSSGINLAGIVANVLAAPFGECIALPLCLSHSLFSALPWLERGAALVASGALLVVKGVARGSAEASLLTFEIPVPDAWQLGATAVLIGSLLIGSRARRGFTALRLGVFALLWGALELAQRRAGMPEKLRVTALDVGQGDATLVDFPDGSLMLIDAGGFVGSPIDPGKTSVLPVLRARRRSRLDVVVLSHPHPDHFGGLRSVIEQVSVGEFWDTGQGAAHGAGPDYARLRALLERRSVRVRGPAELCGKSLHRGPALLEVLAPCPSFQAERSANDNSFVLRVRYGIRAALLVGDAEREAEAELLRAAPERLHADFLKVGHHGSRTSTSPQFLAAVRPTWATISCGVRNRFGHPHPEALAALRAYGVHSLRLDQSGSVVFSSDGERIELSAFQIAR